MTLSPKTCQLLTLAAFAGLMAIIVILCLTLSQAWRNERFLDAELNKMTTYGTNK